MLFIFFHFFFSLSLPTILTYELIFVPLAFFFISSLPPPPTRGLGRKLQFSKLPVEVPVMFRVVELPVKQHICKVKSLNKGDANSEVTVYYQVGPQA